MNQITTTLHQTILPTFLCLHHFVKGIHIFLDKLAFAQEIPSALFIENESHIFLHIIEFTL